MARSVIFTGAWNAEFATGWRAVEHQHPNVWEIMLVIQGSVDVHVAGRQQRGVAGCVFIHAPRTSHWETTVSQEPLKMAGFYVTPPARRFQLPSQMQDRYGHIGHALEWINDIQASEGSSLPILDHLARAVVNECQRKEDPVHDPRLVRVRHFVNEAGHKELSIAKLAEIAGMSRRHFTREFTLSMHLSPMAYVRKVRLENARRAISLTNLPLRVIAEQTGFRDEYEFSRVFRRAMGFAPSALRKKSR